MKKIILSAIAIVAISISTFAQSPEAFKYQAVVRDASQNVLPNQAVGMQLTVLQGSATGTIVYQETFAPTSNAYGLVNLEIGTGTVVSGIFSTIDWSAGPYFIETAMDALGGTSYVVMGASQLLSVPYALYAKTAQNVANDMVNDADSVIGNEYNTTVVLNGTNLETTDGGGTITTNLSSLQDGVNDADSVIGNEYNTTVVLNGTNLETTDGGGTITTNLSALAVDNINDADSVIGNEYNTTVVLNGTNLETTDGGGTITTDVSSLMVGADTLWQKTGNDIYNLNTGNVGIGTTTPSEKVSITNGSLYTNGEGNGVIVGAAGFKGEGLMKYFGRSTMLVGNVANPLAVRLGRWSGGTITSPTSLFDDLVISGATGNVGIGTATPTAKLSLGNDLSNTKLALWDNGAGGRIGLGIQGSNFIFHLNQSADNYNFYDDVNLTNNLMTIKGTGNVGIGTSTPSATLDVVGTVQVVDGTEGTGKVLTSDAAGNASWQGAVAFKAIRSTNLNVGSGNVKVTHDSEQYDISGNYDPATGRFTAPTAGVYQFSAGMYRNETNNQRYAIQIYKNGVFVHSLEYSFSYLNNNNVRNGSFSFFLNPGDFVEVYSFATIACTVISGENNFFSGFMVK